MIDTYGTPLSSPIGSGLSSGFLNSPVSAGNTYSSLSNSPNSLPLEPRQPPDLGSTFQDNNLISNINTWQNQGNQVPSTMANVKVRKELKWFHFVIIFCTTRNDKTEIYYKVMNYMNATRSAKCSQKNSFVFFL